MHDDATIQSSVIGQHCVIGPRAALRNAYVFDGAHVGADCVVEDSIVGAGARLGDGAVVRGGCLVGDGVVLGPGAKLRKFDRVSRKRDTAPNGAQANGEEEEEEEDSEVEEVEQRKSFQAAWLQLLVAHPVTAHLSTDQDQEGISQILGAGSNALLWPPRSSKDDEELNEVEAFNNQRLMRIGTSHSHLLAAGILIHLTGDTASDLELSDPGSISEDDSDSETDSDADGASLASSTLALSRTSSATSLSGLTARAAQSEFRHEAAQSLERAFLEGHSVDNAAVELKTLRMASNVPLREVREAVVGALVERIELVAEDVVRQRKAIGEVVGRWGGLIDKIGGMDPVETVEVLQYHCATSARLPLFGQLLAALYQHDIVEEDHIRAWYQKPAARGEGLKDGHSLEGVRRCWAVGRKMIEQFDEQESSDDEDDEEEGAVEKKAPAQATNKTAGKDEESEDEEDEDEDEEAESEDEDEESEEEPGASAKPSAPSQAPQAPAAPQPKSVPPAQPAPAPASSEEASGSEDEEEEDDDDDEDDDEAESEDADEAQSAPAAVPQTKASPAAIPQDKANIAQEAVAQSGSIAIASNKPAPAPAPTSAAAPTVVPTAAPQTPIVKADPPAAQAADEESEEESEEEDDEDEDEESEEGESGSGESSSGASEEEHEAAAAPAIQRPAPASTQTVMKPS